MKKEQTFRVAILVDSLNIQAWVYQSIEHIQTLDRVEICCVVVDSVKQKTSATSPIQGLLNKSLGKLFDGDITGDDYRYRQNIKSLLSDIPTHTINDDTEKSLSILNDQGADVLIKYTSRTLVNQSTLSLAYGVWDHLFSDSAIHKPGYEGFWETLLSQPGIGSSLQVSHAQLATEKTIFQSYSCTHEASIYGTNNQNYWKSSVFAARALKQIRDRGSEFFFSHLSSKEEQSEVREQAAPSHSQYATLLLKKVIFKVNKKLKYKRYFEQWSLLYNLNPETVNNMSSFIKLLPPKDVFWADPHVIFENNKYYIFIEELPFSIDKGHLSVIEMDQDGNFSQPTKILEKKYHLSYPNVFKYKDEYFMIPETLDNSTIELYQCVQFPYKWEFVMNLMKDVEAVDATLHFQDNKWWLFANFIESKGASPHDELFLFYSEGSFMTTDWTPHPLNPIVSDVRKARPAGKIYTENGKVYRPSQNCSHRYGYGINFNEITLLSETGYEEKIATSIEPDWDEDVIATHTYSKVKDLVVMDGIVLRKK